MGKLIEKIKKRLYEWSKPDIPEMEPVKLEVTHTTLRHYAVMQRVSKYEWDNIPQKVWEHHIAKALANQLTEAIIRNIETEKDYYREDVVYRLDIWLKS